MPSPFGHALAGVATAWGTERSEGPSASTRLTLVCAALAALPDIDLLIPGAHRTVTHSLFAVLVTIIVAAVVTGRVTGKIRWRIAATCGAAYASHLLLDWLGADPNLPSGIQLFWPHAQWFIAPVTIFPGTERRHLLSIAAFLVNAKAFAVESLVLVPIVWILGSRRMRRQRGVEGAGSFPAAPTMGAEVPQAYE